MVHDFPDNPDDDGERICRNCGVRESSTWAYAEWNDCHSEEEKDGRKAK